MIGAVDSDHLESRRADFHFYSSQSPDMLAWKLLVNIKTTHES